MSVTDDLSTPQDVMLRLDGIERDLAVRQNGYEAAARGWYNAKREIEREKARQLLSSTGKTVTEKKADAEIAAYDVENASQEAEYEAYKAVLRVLEARSMICMSLLRAQGRA